MYHLYNAYRNHDKVNIHNHLSDLPSYDSIVFVPCMSNPAGGRTCAKFNICE